MTVYRPGLRDFCNDLSIFKDTIEPFNNQTAYMLKQNVHKAVHVNMLISVLFLLHKTMPLLLFNISELRKDFG